MGTGVVVWSQTPASNGTIDSAVNFAEGQAPSSVNDSARGMMAATAKWRDDLNGSLVLGGTSSAYTLTTNQGFSALAAGLQVAFQVNVSNALNPTIAVDGLAAKPIRSSPGSGLWANFFLAGGVYRLTYFTSNSGEWIIDSYPYLGDLQVDSAKLAANAVTTAKITDANVTNAKLANMANATIKGRATSGTGVPEDITLGQGLVLNSTTLTAPAFPPSGAFKSLVIKVTGNTGLTAAADFVTTTDGTNYQTTALSSTINMGTTGANALDTGSIASATWYAIWAIAKADGTTAGLASTSFTSPTMPSGYTYKARIGAVRTASGSAQLLGTWQFGNRSQFVLGLAQSTVANLTMASGSAGDLAVPTWVAVSTAAFAPSTASTIRGYYHVFNGGVIVAPNNSYQGNNSTSSGPPTTFNFGPSPAFGGQFEFIKESSNIYWASNSSNSHLFAFGWEDNL